MLTQTLTSHDFLDQIRRYDSCSLSYSGVHALYAWLEELADGGCIEGPICIGDWAIGTCEYTVAEFNADYGTTCETCEDVAEWFDSGSAVIVVDESTMVLVD